MLFNKLQFKIDINNDELLRIACTRTYEENTKEESEEEVIF
jgi:hypothetical protein